MLSSQVRFSSGWHVLSDRSRSQWVLQLKGKNKWIKPDIPQRENNYHRNQTQTLLSVERNSSSSRQKTDAAAQNKVLISWGQTRSSLQDRGDPASPKTDLSHRGKNETSQVVCLLMSENSLERKLMLSFMQCHCPDPPCQGHGSHVSFHSNLNSKLLYLMLSLTDALYQKP